MPGACPSSIASAVLRMGREQGLYQHNKITAGWLSFPDFDPISTRTRGQQDCNLIEFYMCCPKEKNIVQTNSENNVLRTQRSRRNTLVAQVYVFKAFIWSLQFLSC